MDGGRGGRRSSAPMSRRAVPLPLPSIARTCADRVRLGVRRRQGLRVAGVDQRRVAAEREVGGEPRVGGREARAGGGDGAAGPGREAEDDRVDERRVRTGRRAHARRPRAHHGQVGGRQRARPDVDPGPGREDAVHQSEAGRPDRAGHGRGPQVGSAAQPRVGRHGEIGAVAAQVDPADRHAGDRRRLLAERRPPRPGPSRRGRRRRSARPRRPRRRTCPPRCGDRRGSCRRRARPPPTRAPRPRSGGPRSPRPARRRSRWLRPPAPRPAPAPRTIAAASLTPRRPAAGRPCARPGRARAARARRPPGRRPPPRGRGRARAAARARSGG